jgi:exonuclease VII small subunit
MTNEEIQRVMEFIIKQQESFAEGMTKAETRLTRLEGSFVHLHEVVSELGKAQKTLTDTVTQLAESQKQLAESLAHTDQRVNVLIDILMQGRNGKDQE